MAACSLCKCLLESDSKIKCDICNLDFCLKCIPLGASEERVIPVKKRNLMVCCPTCKPMALQSLKYVNEVAYLHREIELLRNTIKDKDVIIEDKGKIIEMLEKIPHAHNGENSVNLSEEIHHQKKKKGKANITKTLLEVETEDKVQEIINLAMDGNDNAGRGNVATSAQQKIKHYVRKESERSAGGRKTGESRPIKVVGSSLAGADIVAQEKTWIFVSKFKSSYTTDDLAEYLERQFPGRNFTCLKVDNRWGTFSSFRVAVDLDLKDSVVNASIWPKGIEVSEYFFRRRNNFGQAKGRGYGAWQRK